jgi:hypothetical protein
MCGASRLFSLSSVEMEIKKVFVDINLKQKSCEEREVKYIIYFRNTLK